ncbi:NAD(+)/NADH kinase [Halorussus litoreus]|uniref:NAD(+)/NADH kinase n=1 Tax=Halorussus litoreus TaxID=1710536 RepID=UPI001300B7A3|nr:NAD(+)/NADH kinase [Halorussus litoreus]
MTVGIVGDGALADRLRETAESGGAKTVCGSAGETIDESAAEVVAENPDFVVAIGESALFALVREGVSVPVLPVGVGPGYGGVPEADSNDGGESAARAAVERLVADEYDTETRAVLDASVGGERAGRALADAMLVTSEPARISEYAVHSRDERVASFRADGVVVSTPTGSHGYGRSAGGPLLEPGSGVVGAVPVAPFAVDVDHWVLAADEPVALTVERDEGEVSLLLDDRTVRTIAPGTRVELVADDALELVRPPDPRPFFER